MKGASATAGDTSDSPVAVDVRVRAYPGTDGEVGGIVVEDFGDLTGRRDDVHCRAHSRYSLPTPPRIGLSRHRLAGYIGETMHGV